jgi:hypothetical protein
MRGDARFAPDGYQYGVRFNDGSVATGWNGSTARQRAEEEARRIVAAQVAWLAKRGSTRPHDRIEPVRRSPDGDWETY